VPALIRKWERKLHLKVARYFLQRMKTKWGSCNHRARHIRAQYRAREKAEGPTRLRGSS
jgi:predicted metal-dependent hydrolase